MRYLWSVPAAVIAWFVVGFSPTYLAGLPDGATAFVEPLTDLVVRGGFAGGVLAGLLVQRLRIAVPLVLVVAAGSWWLSANSFDSKELLVCLLAASAVGGLFGALGTRSSVLAAFALSLPVAWYALRPADKLADWHWIWQLNGLLVGAGLAGLLYVACWRRGWPSAYSWLPLAATYLASFAVVAGLKSIDGGGSTDDVANRATDAFFKAFAPLLRNYWPWLTVAVLLAIPMVALKIRALPPPPPPPTPYDERGNDAVLSDDLDWIDRTEPKRRLLARRESV